MSENETLVVRRHWNEWRKATIKLADFQSPHWDQISGGVGRASPYRMVYGYIYCNQILSGELAHTCEHGPGPHRIKVVVVKKDNTASVNKIVRAAADDDAARKAIAFAANHPVPEIVPPPRQ